MTIIEQKTPHQISKDRKTFDIVMRDMCYWFKVKKPCDIIQGKMSELCLGCDADNAYNCLITNDEEFYSELSHSLAIDNFEYRYMSEKFILDYIDSMQKQGHDPMDCIEALAYVQIYAHLVLVMIEHDARTEGKQFPATYGRSIKQQFIDYFAREIE